MRTIIFKGGAKIEIPNEPAKLIIEEILKGWTDYKSKMILTDEDNGIDLLVDLNEIAAIQ